MDNGSGQAITYNSFYQYDYGNADLDTRQRLALTMTYDLPFGKTMTGWQRSRPRGGRSTPFTMHRPATR